jgi:elongator complex protein 4
MKTIPADILSQKSKSGQQTYLDLAQKSTAWETMSDILSRLSTYLDKVEKNTAVRLAINELGGGDWGDPTAQVSYQVYGTAVIPKADTQEIHRFLHALRSLTRSRSVGTIITLPPHLVSTPPAGWTGGQEDWIKSLAWMTDSCIEMHGFAGELPGLEESPPSGARS